MTGDVRTHETLLAHGPRPLAAHRAATASTDSTTARVHHCPVEHGLARKKTNPPPDMVAVAHAVFWTTCKPFPLISLPPTLQQHWQAAAAQHHWSQGLRPPPPPGTTCGHPPHATATATLSPPPQRPQPDQLAPAPPTWPQMDAQAGTCAIDVITSNNGATTTKASQGQDAGTHTAVTGLLWHCHHNTTTKEPRPPLARRTHLHHIALFYGRGTPNTSHTSTTTMRHTHPPR